MPTRGALQAQMQILVVLVPDADTLPPCHRAFRSSPRYASPTGEAKYVTLGAAATRHTTPVGRTGQELTQKAVVAINHHTTRTPERNVYPLLVHLALIWASFFFFFACPN
jgi:hypothetical protein